MPDFTPENPQEERLAALLSGREPRIWQFLTPLAEENLWFIMANHPDLEDHMSFETGDRITVCVFQGPSDSVVGLYTSEARAEAGMKLMNLSFEDMACASADAPYVFRLVRPLDTRLIFNPGLPGCEMELDPQLVDLFLSRLEK